MEKRRTPPRNIRRSIDGCLWGMYPSPWIHAPFLQSSTRSRKPRGPNWEEEEEEEEEFEKNLKIPKLIFTIDISNLLNFIVATG